MLMHSILLAGLTVTLSAGIGIPVLFEPEPGRSEEFTGRAGGLNAVIRPGGADLLLGAERERIALRLTGARQDARAEALDRMPSVTHYYPGSNPKEWRIGVPHFGRVRYRSVYPGIDLVYYGKDGKLEYDFEVAPGANPRQIGLEFEGARSVIGTAEGDLSVSSPHHSFIQRKPVAFQMVNGIRVNVAASYRLRAQRVTVNLGKYDRSLPLVIDPQIVYGVNLYPSPDSVKVIADAQGSAYALNANLVSRHSPQGALIYLIVLGQGFANPGTDFALDSAGNLHVTGLTAQSSFPLVNPFRTQFSGNEVYLVRLSPQGTIIFSSFVAATPLVQPGQSSPQAAVAAGADGSSYVMGTVPSASGFSKKNAQPNGADSTVFVSKVSANGTLDWATLLPAFPSGQWDIRHPRLTAVNGGVTAAGVRCPIACVSSFGQETSTGFFLNGLAEQAGIVSSRFVRTYEAPAMAPVKHQRVQDAPFAIAGAGPNTFFLREFMEERETQCGVYPGQSKMILAQLDAAGNEVAARDLSSAALGCQGPLSLVVNGAGEPVVGSKSTIAGGPAANWQRFSPNLSSVTGSFYTRVSGTGLATASTSDAEVRHADAAGAIYVTVWGVDALGVLKTLQKIVPTGGESGTQNLLPSVTLISPAQGQFVASPFQFRWNPAPNAQGYLLEIRKAVGGYFPRDYVEARQVAGGTTSSATSPALAAGQYVARVRPCGASYAYVDCGPSTDWTGFNVSAPPITVPAEGSVLTQSTTNLQWQSVPGATSYELQLFRNGTLFASDRFPTSILNAPYSLPSGNYQMTINGAAVNFRVQLGPIPSVKTTVTSANVTGGNSLTAAFATVAGADLYLVQVVQPGAGPGGGALTVASKMVSATPVTLSVPAGAAFVLVNACNADGCGPISDAFPVNATGPSPAAPVIATPAAATVVNGPVVMFSWSRIPGDNGSNTTYRLYAQDMGAARPALDVMTTSNFWAARLRPGVRYDVLAIANPGPNQTVGPPSGFVVNGPALTAPSPTQPAYQGVVSLGGATGPVTLEWMFDPPPFTGSELLSFEYRLVSDGPSPHSLQNTLSAPVGLSVGRPASAYTTVTLQAGRRYTGAVRLCSSDRGLAATCTPWSSEAGNGVFNFSTVQ